MKDSLKILLYFVAVVILGALLAPPLFWAGRSLAEHVPALKILRDSDFQRYFHRAILVAAVVLLIPSCRWLHVPGWKIFSPGTDPLPFQHLIIGFLLTFLVIGLFAFGVAHFEIWKWKTPLPWHRCLEVIGAALIAPIIEEFFFRGALMRLIGRAASQWWALLFVSALYSAVHFLKPIDTPIAAHSVTWLSGFHLIPPSFDRFSNPEILLAGFATLFLFGLILGYAAIKTRGLWFSIGLHSGAILAKFSFTKLAKFRGDHALPWFSSDLTVGVSALLVMVFLFFLVWLTLGKRA